VAGNRIEVARLDTIADDDVRAAHRERTRTGADGFLIRSPRTGQELSVAFAPFPPTFERAWEAIVLTPTDDFVGALKATNRQMMILIALLSAVELFLIYLLATRLARPIESVSDQLRSLEALSFDTAPSREPRSRVREIAQLQDAVGRVRASLRSFARYAPEEVVREVAVSGNEAMLSADRREVTALFCDLRGFTSFVEQVGPEEVVAILNDHFDALATIIVGQGGYVVDFLGDGFFAVFGAPEPRTDHAERAVACAIDMQLCREAKNRDYFLRGWPPLEMGVGVNTGPAVVGNMGSSHRIKYGVVGHPVNLAARIESFTTGGQILVSESTRAALGERLVADGPLEAEGKGVSATIRMWAVRRLAGDPPRELPAPVPDLVALPSPIEVRLRPITGKQVGAVTHPATVVRLSAAGAEVRTGFALSVFDALQVLFPAEVAGAAAVHARVMAGTEEPDGRRLALVRFSGLDWETRATLDVLARVGE
jgi:class 3 adenylate cyclase